MSEKETQNVTELTPVALRCRHGPSVGPESRVPRSSRSVARPWRKRACSGLQCRREPREPGDVCWKAETEGRDRRRGARRGQRSDRRASSQSRATGALAFTAQTSRVPVFLFNRLACARDMLGDMLGTGRPRHAPPLCLPALGWMETTGPVQARVDLRRRPSWALWGAAQHSGLGPAPRLWNWERVQPGAGAGPPKPPGLSAFRICLDRMALCPVSEHKCPIVPLYYNARYFLAATG